MGLMKEIKEGMRRYAKLSPEEKEEVAKDNLDFLNRSRESIEQFNKDCEEYLKVSRKSMEMVIDI